MRTKNIAKNVISNFLNNLLVNILRFVVRTAFIKTIGEIYLGVNGLLSNILGLLALAELGISTTIGYNLYKPLSDNNTQKIRTLMNYYRKAYMIVSIVVLVSGLILLPFLPLFIEDTTGIYNLSLIFIIYLGNMVISYLFSYKRVLIISDQKNYKITPIIMLTNIVQNTLQIVVLFIFRNYILYLLIQTFTTILENILVNRYIIKQYPYLKNLNSAKKLEKKELTSIKKGIKGIFIHKIGYYVLTSTDNLIVSKMIGIVYVGLLSNYVLIKNTVKSFMDLIISNLISSIGNLIVTSTNEKKEKIFNELNLFCFFVYSVTTICFINLFNPFIQIWLGDNYLLSWSTALVISLNYFLSGMVGIVETFKGAAGLYYNDRFVPVVQAIINLFISILFTFKFGILGVLLGTLISYSVPFIFKPIIVYKNIFRKSSKEYFVWFLKKSLLFFTMLIITMYLIKKVCIFNIYVNLILNICISALIPITILVLIYRKDESFISFLGRFKILFKKG